MVYIRHTHTARSIKHTIDDLVYNYLLKWHTSYQTIKNTLRALRLSCFVYSHHDNCSTIHVATYSLWADIVIIPADVCQGDSMSNKCCFWIVCSSRFSRRCLIHKEGHISAYSMWTLPPHAHTLVRCRYTQERAPSMRRWFYRTEQNEARICVLRAVCRVWIYINHHDDLATIKQFVNSALLGITMD